MHLIGKKVVAQMHFAVTRLTSIKLIDILLVGSPALMRVLLCINNKTRPNGYKVSLLSASSMARDSFVIKGYTELCVPSPYV